MQTHRVHCCTWTTNAVGNTVVIIYFCDRQKDRCVKYVGQITITTAPPQSPGASEPSTVPCASMLFCSTLKLCSSTPLGQSRITDQYPVQSSGTFCSQTSESPRRLFQRFPHALKDYFFACLDYSASEDFILRIQDLV